MLESVKQLIKNAKKLNQNQLIVEVFEDNEVKTNIVYYITAIQLFQKGEDGLGKKLSPYSFPYVKKTKIPRGQPYDRTTLRLTGKFYFSFRVLVNSSGEVKITANDPNGLTEYNRYGINILTLSDDGIEKIKPQVIEKIKEYVIRTLFA